MLTVDAEALRDLKLTTFPAELRPGGEGVTALGELKVNEGAYAEVGAPIPARVVRLIASPGQYVRRGQPLAELQSVELGQARAQRTAARARAELARQTVERKRGLAAERIVSQRRAAAGRGGRSPGPRRSCGRPRRPSPPWEWGREAGDLSGFTLLSPISGTVLERMAVQGQTADPSKPLFRIGDLSRLWLIVQSPERDADPRALGLGRRDHAGGHARPEASRGRSTGSAARWILTRAPSRSASSCPTRAGS